MVHNVVVVIFLFCFEYSSDFWCICVDLEMVAMVVIFLLMILGQCGKRFGISCI